MCLHDKFKSIRSCFHAMILLGQLPTSETDIKISRSGSCLTLSGSFTKPTDRMPKLRSSPEPYTAQAALEKINRCPPIQPNFAREGNAECMVFEVNARNRKGTDSPTILAIKRPNFESLSNERDSADYQLRQLTSDNESHMYMLQQGCRTWAINVKPNDPDYIRREMINHIMVYKNMRLFWCVGTIDLDGGEVTKSAIDTCRDGGKEGKVTTKRKKRIALSMPRVPVPEERALVYRSCDSGSAITGFVMEYIPPIYADHARALASRFLDPKIREYVKSDPDLKQVRFLVQFGVFAPVDEPKDSRLSSRPVYLNQLWHEDPWFLGFCAKQMGATLAILHWACRLDAAGVKFHVSQTRRRPGLWLTNFGDCKPLKTEDDTTAMAEACYNNLTWPRPECAYHYEEDSGAYECIEMPWTWFAHAYVSTSNAILVQHRGGPAKSLPMRFIGKVMSLAGGRKFSEGRRYEDWLVNEWGFIERWSAASRC